MTVLSEYNNYIQQTMQEASAANGWKKFELCVLMQLHYCVTLLLTVSSVALALQLFGSLKKNENFRGANDVHIMFHGSAFMLLFLGIFLALVGSLVELAFHLYFTFIHCNKQDRASNPLRAKALGGEWRFMSGVCFAIMAIGFGHTEFEWLPLLLIASGILFLFVICILQWSKYVYAVESVYSSCSSTLHKDNLQHDDVISLDEPEFETVV